MGKSGAGGTREAKALTTRGVEALRPDAEPYRVPDSRTTGLAVRVATDGRRTWDLAYRITGTGKMRRTSLGVFPDVGIEDARDRAREITRAARLGRDLLEEEAEARREASRAISVESLIDTYVKRAVAGRLRTATEIEARLKRALASLLSDKAAAVRRRDIRAALDECADAGTEREAEKRRQTVGAMFRWAVAQDLIEADPTAGLRAYDPGTPRTRILSGEEIVALWRWLEACDLPPDHAEVLRLQLLLGARVGEIGGMMPREIDPDVKVWTLPAVRSKNKAPRATPLTGTAREILARRLPCRGPLFQTETAKPLAATHLGNALNSRRRALPIAHFTTHDLRRTVASGMAELGISLETIAAVIGHEAGTKGTRTLVRHYVKADLLERKTVALEAWERHLMSLIAGEAPAPNVVALADRRG